MSTFGESAPGKKVFEKFGFTAENVAERKKVLNYSSNPVKFWQNFKTSRRIMAVRRDVYGKTFLI